MLQLAACAALPAHACDLDRWQPDIAEAAHRYELPETWIRAVMRAESAGCSHLNGWPITSPAGAMGLLQLMPAIWAEPRLQSDFGANPSDSHDNIPAGAAYLPAMFHHSVVPGAFVASHAGPAHF